LNNEKPKKETWLEETLDLYPLSFSASCELKEATDPGTVTKLTLARYGLKLLPPQIGFSLPSK